MVYSYLLVINIGNFPLRNWELSVVLQNEVVEHTECNHILIFLLTVRNLVLHLAPPSPHFKQICKSSTQLVLSQFLMEDIGFQEINITIWYCKRCFEYLVGTEIYLLLAMLWRLRVLSSKMAFGLFVQCNRYCSETWGMC